jgi:hypothetical protein
MPKKISKKDADRILTKYKKIHEIRQRSLELVVKINKKVGDAKLQKIAKRLEELTNAST